MGNRRRLADLRTRVTELVEQEGQLLAQALVESRGGGNRPGVDALIAQVQLLQVERNRVRKEIGSLLGEHRMHIAAEVWKPGVYAYRPEPGGAAVRVRVTSGPLGLQVMLPNRSASVPLDTLQGSFEGPLAADDDTVDIAPPR